MTHTLTYTSIGLAIMQPEGKEQVAQLLDRVLPPEDGPLGCTAWISHLIDVSDTRPIKQRYYPVSPKIEEEMHEQAREMLESEVVGASNSG